MVLLGAILLADEKLSKRNISLKNCKIEFLLIALGIAFCIFYVSRIVFPNVSSYTGKFVDSHRDSTEAPPIPVTSKYTFWNGEGKKKVVYLDTFSKKKIYPLDFEKGKMYTVYYDELTKVIVRVEVND